MNNAQQNKFDRLYQQHVNALQRQGKAESTIDVYSRAVRRTGEFYDTCPDRLRIPGTVYLSPHSMKSTSKK